MTDDFRAGRQSNADHNTVQHPTDSEQGDLRQLRPVADLLDLIAEITGVEVKPDNRHARLPLPERFANFHAANPGVYQALRTLAYQGVRAGRKRLSIGAMYERLRELSIDTNGDPWLLDNSFKPFYVRMLMLNEHDLRGRFEVRASIADDVIGRAA